MVKEVKAQEPIALLLQRAYEAGWVQCATWAGRVDLITDCDSNAYTQERDTALAKLTNGDDDAAGIIDGPRMFGPLLDDEPKGEKE